MIATDAEPARGGSDRMRRQNLATVLERVHHSGGLSRAALTHETGLNRSTIGALVAELAERGLVREADPEPSTRAGRPSPTVVPSASALAVAVHPEVDAIEVGLVSLGGTVAARRRHELDAAPSVVQTVDVATRLLAELTADRGDATLLGVGVAVPGLVRARDSLVRLAPHLDWVDEPLGELLHDATGLPVRAANDASLGAQAERMFGAGRGVDDLIYLNGGASGIGGGIIAGGALLGGVEGYAGEFGHIAVRGDDCPSLEDEVSRAALMRVLGLATAAPDVLATALAAAIAAGDRAVVDEVHRQLRQLSVSLRNAVNVLNPELIVLGGFLAALYAADPEFLEARVEERSLAAPFAAVRFAPAALGDELLMIGAAEIALAAVLGDPATVG